MIKLLNEPLVSVCIPNYNNGKYIFEFVNNILKQSYKNIEVIISDNNSTDNSRLEIMKIKNKKVKINFNKKNIGPGNNYNKCVSLSKGEYVCIFHPDDIYKNNIIEEQLKLLENRKDVVAAFTIANNVDEKGYFISLRKLPFNLKSKYIIGDKDFFFNKIIEYGNFFFCPSFICRRKEYISIGGFNPDVKMVDDLDLWIRLLKDYKVCIINEPLVNYRIHLNQATFMYNKFREDLSEEYRLYDKLIAENIFSFKSLVKYNKMKSRGLLFAATGAILNKNFAKSKKNTIESKRCYTFKSGIWCIIQLIFSIYFIHSLLRIFLKIFIKILKTLKLNKTMQFLNFI